MTGKLNTATVKYAKPGMHLDGDGLYLQVTQNGKSWLYRFELNGRARQMGLGSFKLIGLAEARNLADEARRLVKKGIDPIEQRKEDKKSAPYESNEQRIRRKAVEFLDNNIEPECYLYRHYHPNGDLLYVGISLDPLDRTRKHFAEARWRYMISHILVEPFATREDALAAEREAIRTEFPKFNNVHNGKRHPVQELSQVGKAQP